MIDLSKTTSPLNKKVLLEINRAFGPENWALSGSNLFYCLGLINRTEIHDIDIAINETGYKHYLKYYDENFISKLSNNKKEALYADIKGYESPLFYQFLFIIEPLKKIDTFVYSDIVFKSYITKNINLYDIKVNCFDTDYLIKIKERWIGSVRDTKKHIDDCKLYNEKRENL